MQTSKATTNDEAAPARAKPLRRPDLSLRRLLCRPTERPELTVERVSAELGVTVGDILSRTRLRHVAHARAVVAWVLRQHELSFPAIGRLLGRDHTSIMTAVRKIEGERRHCQRSAEVLDAMVFGGCDASRS